MEVDRAAAPGCAAWFSCWLLIGGCNAVLGIDPPADGVRDAGLGGDLLGGDDDPVRVGSDELDAALDDDSGEPAPAPSEYAWPAWPMPNPVGAAIANPQLFSTRQEGVVADSVTQLEWQQTVDGEQRTWEEAAGYCAGLELAGGGFRLPARIELLSLIDFTRPNPAIDPSAFPDAPGDRFWSSSPFAGSRSTAWLINFEFGTGFSVQGHRNEQHRVRCVR